MMKFPILFFIVLISFCLEPVFAQTEFFPPVPIDSSSQHAQGQADPSHPAASQSPAPALINVDVLNDNVKLEKGDRVSYRVVEDRTPAVTLIITDAGEIDIPMLGHLQAAGKTCKQLADEIKPALESHYYYKATVIVGLVTHSDRSIGKVYVMGRVSQPSGLEIPPSETLSLTKAIARAQGFSDFADKQNVRLIRKHSDGKNEMIIVDAAEILDKGLIEKDPLILPNDIIIVPEVKVYRAKVYVLGKVGDPAGLDMDQNEKLTVSKAITRVHGFSEFADRERVKLLRKNVVVPYFVVEDMLNPFALANKIISSPDPLSKHLKTLFSPVSLEVLANPASTKQQQKFVLIEELNKAIQGALLYDDQRFLDISLSADAKRLKAQNPKDSDLIRLNRILLEDAYSHEIKRNRPPEYQTFIVNVAEIIDKGMVDKDPVLVADDLVIVPESKRTFSRVSIMGQVHYPQTWELQGGGNFSVSQVIAHAGGFSDFANKSKVKLLRKRPPDSYLFVADDIVKPTNLAKKLREAKDPLSRFLWEHFTNPSQQILLDRRSKPQQIQMTLVTELNRFTKAGLLYTEERFALVKIPPELSLSIAAQSNTCLLVPNDFLDVSGFVLKLSAHADPFFQFLWNQFTEQERKVVEDATLTSRLQEASLMEVLLTRVNSTLKEGSIYNPQIFEKIELSPESLNLLTQNPKGEELVHLNRMLLEDACPQEIKKTMYNPRDKAIISLNRRLFETAYPDEIRRHEEYQTIIVNMDRIINRAELDKDPYIEPDDLIIVPERWINF